jgi:diguanylate cyclase (GGDEF)-like protein
MELKLYLQMLQRSWWIVLLTALAALCIALLAAYFLPPKFRSSTRLIVSPNLTAITDEREVVNAIEALDKRSIISTYAEVINSGRVYDETTASLGIPSEVLEDYTYSTVVLPDANILEFSVEGPNPELVALIANNVGSRAIEFITNLYTSYNIDILDVAPVPDSPISPQPLRDSILAFGLGLVIGAVLAIIREQLRLPFEQLLQRSVMDRLSSAFTRRHFNRVMGEFLPTNTGGAALGLIRLNGLQGVIETLPQPLAQQILRSSTDMLRNELRGYDSVGRWNDNTFSVFLPNTTGKGAVTVLGRIQLALSKPLRINEDGETLHLEPSVGVADVGNNENSTTLIGRAEQALDEAGKEESRMYLFKANPFLSI